MNSKGRRASPGANERRVAGGDPPRTPMGHPVVSRHEALSERILEDWRLHAHESHLPSSAYRLQALYLDFGRATPAEDLAASVLRLREDPRQAARALVGDPRLLEAERRVGRSLAGDLRYYSPLRERREAFCRAHCLPAIGPLPSADRPCLPPRTPAECGMLRILEGFRFFASFPDE